MGKGGNVLHDVRTFETLVEVGSSLPSNISYIDTHSSACIPDHQPSQRTGSPELRPVEPSPVVRGLLADLEDARRRSSRWNQSHRP